MKANFWYINLLFIKILICIALFCIITVAWVVLSIVGDEVVTLA